MIGLVVNELNYESLLYGGAIAGTNPYLNPQCTVRFSVLQLHGSFELVYLHITFTDPRYASEVKVHPGNGQSCCLILVHHVSAL